MVNLQLILIATLKKYMDFVLRERTELASLEIKILYLTPEQEQQGNVSVTPP